MRVVAVVVDVVVGVNLEDDGGTMDTGVNAWIVWVCC